MSQAAIRLRPYQERANTNTRAHWSRHGRKALVVLPTGCGKTMTALSQVVRAAEAGKRALWLAHREELLEQPMMALLGLWPAIGAQAGIVQADRNEATCQVVFASADTLRSPRRLAEVLTAGPFTLIVVDEAHHYRGNSYEALLHQLDADCQARGATPYFLGLTATPDRADGKSLGALWQLVFAYSLIDALDDGYLVPPTYERELLPTLDLSHARTRGGDLLAKDVALALDAAGVVEHTVQALSRHRDRRPMVFTASVPQAEQTCEALRADGWEARWVDGNTPREQRRRMLRGFLDGSVRCLVNCGVLTEGTDLPPCDCIVVARPTRSRPLYTQILGRGLRLHPGKRDCVVVDMVGASDEHSLVVAPVLLAELERAAEQEGKGQPRRTPGAQDDGAPTWRRRQPQQAAWTQLAGVDRDAWAVDCGEHGVVAIYASRDPLYRAVLLQKAGPPIALCAGDVDFDLARGLGEDVARRASALTWGRAHWREQRASDAQRAALGRYRIAASDDMTKGDAEARLTAHKAALQLVRARLVAKSA